MKTIPEEYHLDEADIKEAIKLYLKDKINHKEIDIVFSVHNSPQNFPDKCGGMSDYYVAQTVTAVAYKKNK